MINRSCEGDVAVVHVPIIVASASMIPNGSACQSGPRVTVVKGVFSGETGLVREDSTASRQALTRPLRISVTVGTGRTVADPKAQYLKVFRYKIARI